MDPLLKAKKMIPLKNPFSLVEEFRNFAFRGNVIDLAIGVVIGGAFGKIVDSLVKNLIMPVIGLVLPGEKGYLGWKWVIHGQEIPYGLFIGEVVNFLIVAAAVFLFIVKFLNWIMKLRRAQAEDSAPALTRDQELLTEIRDLLKKKD
jgi:large conductance mechanosensitive channel